MKLSADNGYPYAMKIIIKWYEEGIGCEIDLIESQRYATMYNNQIEKITSTLKPI